MPRVFEITPKRIKRSNNTVLTPHNKKTREQAFFEQNNE